MPLPASYKLRGLEPSDIDSLWNIQAASNAQLAQTYPMLAGVQAPSTAILEAQFVGRGVWIAIDEADKPVGYAIAGELSELFWLHEVAVDPKHDVAAVGVILVAAVVNHAKWAFHNTLGVVALKKGPFAPEFYQKAGFLRVNAAAAPRFLKAQMRKQRPDGIVSDECALMIRKL